MSQFGYGDRECEYASGYYCRSEYGDLYRHLLNAYGYWRRHILMGSVNRLIMRHMCDHYGKSDRNHYLYSDRYYRDGMPEYGDSDNYGEPATGNRCGTVSCYMCRHFGHCDSYGRNHILVAAIDRAGVLNLRHHNGRARFNHHVYRDRHKRCGLHQ
jgi:hypothetical protein